MRPQPDSKFEHEVCSRCGGTGEFSYNPRDGKKCLKCNGAGWVFTKRGAVAHEYFMRLLSKPVGELVAGDTVRDQFTGWHTVKSVSVYDAEQNTLEVTFTDGGGFSNYRPDTLVRVGFTAEQKAPLLAQAVAYQESLNKSGKPSKKEVA